MLLLPRPRFAALVSLLALTLSQLGCAQGKLDEGDTGPRTLDAGDAGPPPECTADLDCDDGVACTVDTCDPTAGTCGSVIDDGNCAPTERCDAALGCVLRPPCEADDDCDDALFCNGTETCDPATGCQAGTPPSCDDGRGCTVDACDPEANACANTPDDALCGNGIVCDGVEACVPEDDQADANGCVPGAPLDCDDDVDCTVDACSEAAGGCESTPDDGRCADTVFCDGVEICHPTTGCMEGSTPSCDDGVGCTDDRCDLDADACAHDLDHASCLDGDVCDGEEVCDATLDCIDGPAFDCGDGLSCTTDRCFGDGMCEHLGSDADVDGFEAVGCDDGTDCNDLVFAVNPDATEVCDGVDNDCSGDADDGAGMECVLGSAPAACTTGCGTAGLAGCNSSCGRTPCVAASETCNGCDDDGDGTPDDGLGCRQGSSDTCVTACGTAGTQACLADCSGYGTCLAANETCNGCDDDGDGTSDEGFTCRRGATRACTTGCGTAGTETCALDCGGWGACVAATETCNGCDDDGDGTADDGFTCRQGALRACTTACGTAGSEQCNMSCGGYETCAASGETCFNGCDDDADGAVDEGCGAPNSVCSGATVLSGASGTLTDTYDNASRTVMDCGSGGELWYRITLSGRRVLYLDTFGSTFDTAISLRTSCGGVAVQCEDDDCGTNQDQLVRLLEAGTYYVAVHAFGAGTTSGTINLRWQTASAGNGAYTRITGNGTYTGTTSGTGTLTTLCGGSSPEAGHFFTLCSGVSRTVTADTCGGASWDTILALRGGDGNSELTCNDDGCGVQSSLSRAIVGPGLFVIQVDGFAGAAGSYSLDVAGL